jgi:hypothetical protein
MENLVDESVMREWKMFQKTVDVNGRTSCQDDFPTFQVMRSSQFLAWPKHVLESYCMDLKNAEEAGRNLISEKYARMMEHTSPVEYEALRGRLPAIEEEKLRMIDQALSITILWEKELAEKYPNLTGRGRPIMTENEAGAFASVETYTRGELATYSSDTLKAYCDFLAKSLAEGENVQERILSFIIGQNGYASLENAEELLGPAY